jgi:GH15 family glucan-1,4-alpha-glucosidase
LSGIPDGHFRDGRLEAVVAVPHGGYHDLVLEIARSEPQDSPVDAVSAWARTERTWRADVPAVEGTLADRDARHAYAVLRGLTSSRGGMVAAATTALPERAEQGRNYDYRYCWIRDQCYAGMAVSAAGSYRLLDDAVHFVSARLLDAGPDLAPAYRIDGRAVPAERHLDLPGYPGGTGIVGNWVNQQFQLDVFGEALLLFAAADKWDRLDRDIWRAVEIAAGAIEQRWTEPDAGIWEIDNEDWTHSRLVCVAGLRAAARIAPPRQSAHWTMLADRVLADTSARCLDRRTGVWRRSPDDNRVDVALLLPAIRGAVAASDPRTVNTLEAVRRDLTQDGYVYRYRHRGRELAEAEGAFLLCGYVMALADDQQGDAWRAVRWFERNRAACGPPGLFTEEFDVIERQMRGDLPQAFVHAMLFETAHRLTDPRS